MSSNNLRYDNRVAIVTGAGGGLGRAYALFFASRGAKVVVNDLGGSRSGTGSASQTSADQVVKEIKDMGGEAIANYDSVENGDKIISQALEKFGRVDILVNNAGILRDKSFAKMTDADWDLVHKIHVRGSYKTTKAVWDIFRKQKYGRIIMTASGSGLYGNYGQANYSSAKLALAGLSNTLSKEGEKYNIHCNAIAPIAASRMTKSTMPPEVFEAMKPEHVVPLVAFLCHEECFETGGIFELGAGQFFKVRWERSSGALFKADSSFLPGTVLQKWNEINDFENPAYPTTMTETDWIGLLDESKKISNNPKAENLHFKNKTVVITGAGGGLGRAYALLFGKLGANVVVNDLGMDKNSQKKTADIVAEQVNKLGGKGLANYDSCLNAEKIINQAISQFGRIDVVINNAGVLRDKSFVKMTDQDWDVVYDIHLKGTYKMCKTVWPLFVKQKYGRIINTASAVGLYGNFGQANYSCAKAGILGLSQTLAIEGQKHNIIVNTIAPNAGTQMTATIMPSDIVEMLKPDYIAPLIGLLAHDKCPETGCTYEVGSCWIARVRWQRTKGYGFSVKNRMIAPEEIKNNWDKITCFDKDATNPESLGESVQIMYERFMNISENEQKSQPESVNNSIKPVEFSYKERDVILYALGLGATQKDLNHVYENSENFKPIATYGVILCSPAMNEIDISNYLPKYDPTMLLHGEQYLEINNELPTSGKVICKPSVVDVLDKGKHAIIILGANVIDAETEQNLCKAEFSLFCRNAGGFGGSSSRKVTSGPQVAQNNIPKRSPDAIIKEKTRKDLAAIYRLSGDYNPLHIDPQFSKIGGFETPILHGLCTYGIASKHIIQKFAPGRPEALKNIKARFSKHVIPGETLETQMWVDHENPNKILFQVKVVERNCYAITNAAVELNQSSKTSRAKL